MCCAPPPRWAQTVASLATLRLDRLDTFVQAHPATVERDDTGAPARAHEVLLLDPDPARLLARDGDRRLTR